MPQIAPWTKLFTRYLETMHGMFMTPCYMGEFFEETSIMYKSGPNYMTHLDTPLYHVPEGWPGSWDFTILCTVFRILINAYYSRDVIQKKTFSINLFITYSCSHIAYMVRVSTTRCKFHPLLYLHSWFLNRNQECFGSTSGSFYRIYVGAFIRRLFNHDLRVERFLKVLQYIIPWNNWLLFLTPQRRT